MKRTVATIALFLALTVLLKLALKPAGPSKPAQQIPSSSASGEFALDQARSADSAPTNLQAKYRSAPPELRDLVARTVARYGRNALAIERTDGERGLQLLDRLDIEAIFLYEKHPDEFRRLAGLMGVDAAADVLWHWRAYFGLKRADDIDRGALIAEIARLGPAQLRIAARYPSTLPLMLAEPQGITELVDSSSSDERTLADCLAVLTFIDLEHGPSDLRAALQTLKRHGPLALAGFSPAWSGRLRAGRALRPDSRVAGRRPAARSGPYLAARQRRIH